MPAARTPTPAPAAAAETVTLPREALAAAVAAVASVVERKTTIPILANLRLTAGGGEVAVVGTDLDIEVRAVARGDLAGGAVDLTVPAALLNDILRKLPEKADVALTPDADGGRLVLRSGRARFTLQALPPGDFPELRPEAAAARFALPAERLAALLSAVRFAASTEETRYYLNGAYLHAVETDAGAKLRAVATDGRRLARMDVDAPQGAPQMPGVIVPLKTLDQLLRLLAEERKRAGKNAEAPPVEVEVSTRMIRFGLPLSGVGLVSKLVDGTFPDYGRVIPTANDRRAVVDLAALSAAVDRVSTISSERGRAVKLSLDDGRLSLEVRNPDAGDSREEMEADYDSAPIEIGFNARYLLDILAEIDGDTVLVKLADPSSPTLIMSREGAAALYVLMPMRV